MIIFDDSFIYFSADHKTANKLNATFIQSKGLYKLPLTLGALREVYNFTHDEKVKNKGLEIKDQRTKLFEIKKQSDAEGDELLRPYQRVDIEFLKRIDHAAIFNEMRTGKTPTCLKLIESEGFNKVIVVCPASLKLNWESEINKWTDFPSIVISGTPKQREEQYDNFKNAAKCILIISYETLRNDIDKIEVKHECLVLDEAHRIRNIKTKQTKAVNKLGKKAMKRIAMTGTPSVNHASDIYGILRFLYPKKWSSYWAFVERYFYINDNFFGKEVGKAKRENELTEELKAFSTQRKRKDIMKWIPKVTKQAIKLEGDKQQLKEYKELLETFEIEQDGDVIVDAISPLAQLTRLRQITLDPSLLGLKGKSPKEQFILEYIEDHPKEPIIIFSTFTSYLRTLAARLKDPATIFGDMKAEEKQANVRKFQEGKSDILLANIISGGTGFTIDRAETIIFLDRSFNPVDNQQAEDRFIPTKEELTGPRLVIDLAIKGTVDEKINKLLREKKNIIEIVNNYGIREIIK